MSDISESLRKDWEDFWRNSDPTRDLSERFDEFWDNFENSIRLLIHDELFQIKGSQSIDEIRRELKLRERTRKTIDDTEFPEREFDWSEYIGKWNTQLPLKDEFEHLRRQGPKWSRTQCERIKHISGHLDKGDVVCNCRNTIPTFAQHVNIEHEDLETVGPRLYDVLRSESEEAVISFGAEWPNRDEENFNEPDDLWRGDED